MEKMIKVGGMHCKSCEILLTDSISEIEGVEKVSADHKGGTVSVSVKDDAALAEVKKTIEKEGYRVL
ncbi:MAG: heavy metal-associated domain-containing protein [Candidatus Micrarchaeota archaeon]